MKIDLTFTSDNVMILTLICSACCTKSRDGWFRITITFKAGVK